MEVGELTAQCVVHTVEHVGVLEAGDLGRLAAASALFGCAVANVINETVSPAFKLRSYHQNEASASKPTTDTGARNEPSPCNT